MTRARRGFTLLELIIAMAIAAALALVLYSSLSTAYRARQTAMNQTASVREAAIALDLIEADLQSATPLPAAESETTTGGTAIGNASLETTFGPFYGQGSGSGASATDTLTFRCLGRATRTTATGTAADAQDDPLADGVRQVTYAIAADRAGKNVLMRSVVRNLLPTSAAEAEDEPLAGDVTALTFRYYDGTTWTDSWDSDALAALPLAVEAGIDVKSVDAKGVERTYHMTRTVPIACALPATTEDAS